MRARILGFVLVVTALSFSAAGEGKGPVSGPQPGETLPGAFDSRVVNGDFKGKQHCIICENRLFPVVMVFVREPMAPREIAEESPILHLLNKLEAAVERHDISYLKAAAIFLSPHAHSSATTEGKREAKELVEEAKNRSALLRTLTARAEKYKRVVLAAFPAEGPKGYKLNPDAEVTILFFNNLKILANEAYPEGKMTKVDADRFVEYLDKTMRDWKMRPVVDPKLEPKIKPKEETPKVG